MTMSIDLCEHFMNQNIEGIDAHELAMTLDGRSDVFHADGDRVFTHLPSGKKIVLGCAMEYFLPPKGYYRFNSKSRCSFVRKALELEGGGATCEACFQECLAKERQIKPKKVKIAKDYFFK